MDDDSCASYIHMVHHLIEKCLIFHMTKQECMEALSKHANINPIITSTASYERRTRSPEHEPLATLVDKQSRGDGLT
ncbi:uncharacterized protein LOC141596985 isoform X2 [Silene latifolia]|uniref:uncharacterized protein LOC141596985 isoform X2 n=1 Tax=Silene latifolia TaxID=37657 RepID=UPI003D785DBA